VGVAQWWDICLAFVRLRLSTPALEKKKLKFYPGIPRKGRKINITLFSV
jgi:hypothetical protein